MGVVETRFLLRLSPMDFRIMTLEWEGFTNDHVLRLKEEISTLLARATVTEAPDKDAIIQRSKLKYGRIFIENAVQSFEFVPASFGGPPPIGKYPMMVPESVLGCESVNESFPSLNYQQKAVFVRRGECSFLTKALNAKRFNASLLVIVNTDDSLEPPASGYGIDKNISEATVLSLGNFPILSVANTTWSKLTAALRFNLPQSTFVQAVPLHCKSGGVCGPVLEAEKTLQSEVACGVVRGLRFFSPL